MPKILRYAGFAPETTFDEDPAPAAQFHVDIASATLDAPSDTELLYEGGLGRGVRTHRPGFYAPSGNVVHATDIATIGWLLKWALGGYTHTDDTAGTGFHIHELFGVDERILDSFATRLGKDNFEHVFSGCVINELQIEVEDSFVQATADISAARDAKASLQAVADLLLPDEYPLAFHETTAQLGGVDESAKVKSLTLTISNNLDTEAGRGLGSRHPHRIPAAGRDVTGEVSLWYGDTDELERFWGGTDGPAVDGTTEVPLVVSLDAGTDGSLDINLPRTIYTTVQQQPSGRSEITQSGSLRALTDEIVLDDGITSVDSELLATVSNNQVEMV